MRKMKKRLAILLAALIAAALMAGCSAPANAQNTPAPSGTANGDISAMATDSTDTADPEDGMTVAGEWQYYLDYNDPVSMDNGEAPPLHRQKLDGSNDTNLGVQGDGFQIIGNYIYLDSYVQDQDDNQYNSTTRLDLDGTNAKKLEYSDMYRFVPPGSQTMYFTAGGDSVIYVSDLACENVTTLPIALPDQNDIESKIGKQYVTIISISDISDGMITYTVDLTTPTGEDLYTGLYKTTLDGKTTTRIEGNVIDMEDDGADPSDDASPSDNVSPDPSSGQ